MADTKQEKKHQQQLNDIAKRLPDAYLLCRDMGHTWKPEGAAWLQGGGIERVLACTQCSAKRVQTLDKNGYILGGHYTYPDGYSFTGMGRIDRTAKAVLRKASVLRSFNL